MRLARLKGALAEPPQWYQRAMWRAWMTMGPATLLLPLIVVAGIAWAVLVIA